MGGGEGLSRATATALVTTGSEILQKLEQLVPYELLRLKIDELHTLLVNADGRFFAVAVAYAAQAPPVLPFSFARVMCGGENIPNLKVEWLLELFLPAFDPVLPYATYASGPLAPTRRKPN
jgi:hypothetical protein